MKAVYDVSEIIYSDGWNTDDYRTSDQKRSSDRQKIKEDKAAALGGILQLVEENNICSFAVLTRLVYTQHPEYKELLLDKSPFIGRYVDSRRYDLSCGFGDRQYSEVCNMLDVLETDIADLSKRNGVLTVELEKAVRKNVEMREKYNALFEMYCTRYFNNDYEQLQIDLNDEIDKQKLKRIEKR